MLLNLFSIFIGGGLGSVLRYLIGLLYLRVFNYNFPLATLSVNLVGSLLLGILAANFYDNTDIPEHIKISLIVGFCGGFTTFSAFALEIVDMLKRSEYMIAIFYIVLSLFLSIFAAAAGFYWAKTYVG